MTLAQAAELLHEAADISEASESAAAQVSRDAGFGKHTYTEAGHEAMAEAEHQTRFEHHIAAQQEQPSDPFTLDQADLDELG